MHTGEPRGKRGIASVTVMYFNVGQPLILAASKNHPLLNGVTALVRVTMIRVQQHCQRQQQREAD